MTKTIEFNDSVKLEKDQILNKLKEQRLKEIEILIDYDLEQIKSKLLSWENINYLTVSWFQKKKAHTYQIGWYPFNPTKEEISEIYKNIIEKKNIILYEMIKEPEEINLLLKPLNLKYGDKIEYCHVYNIKTGRGRSKERYISIHLDELVKVWYIKVTNTWKRYLTCVSGRLRFFDLDDLKFNEKEGFVTNKDFEFKMGDLVIRKTNWIKETKLNDSLSIVESHFNENNDFEYKKELVKDGEKINWNMPDWFGLIESNSYPTYKDETYKMYLLRQQNENAPVCDGHDYYGQFGIYFTDSESKDLSPLIHPNELYPFMGLEKPQFGSWYAGSSSFFYNPYEEIESLPENFKMNSWFHLMIMSLDLEGVKDGSTVQALFYKNKFVTCAYNKYFNENMYFSKTYESHKDFSEYSEIKFIKDDYFLVRPKETNFSFKICKYNEKDNKLDDIFFWNQIEINNYIEKELN